MDRNGIWERVLSFSKVTLFVLLALCMGLGKTNAQYQENIDFKRASVLMKPKPLTKTIEASVVYAFEVLADVDSLFMDAVDMTIQEFAMDGRPVAHINTGKKIIFRRNFKEGNTHKISITYTAKPQQSVYFSGWSNQAQFTPDKKVPRQIWTQGQGKYTSHWLPSFDDMRQKVEFDFSIRFDRAYTVIANGQLVKKESLGKDLLWHYDMGQVMSSYLCAFAIGVYSDQSFTSSEGIPIRNFYYPQDSLKVAYTYQHTKDIFDYLEQEIGVAYPWNIYKQAPVHDFLYAAWRTQDLPFSLTPIW